MANEDVVSINLQERITPLGDKLMRRLTLWGRDVLLRIPPINSAGDELPLLVILNPVGDCFLFVKGRNSAGDDLSVATSMGLTF